MPKIFISHSSADKKFVRRLAKDLRMLGHDVWLDEWNITVGQDIVEELERGIDTSDFVILVLTESLVKSNWAKREWGTRLFSDQSDGRATILPLLKEDCEIPSLLRTKKYADFRRSYAVGMGQLEAAIVRFFDGASVDAISQLTSGVDQIVSQIEASGRSPGTLFSFERTSAIVASIVAQRMHVEEVLCVNRRIRTASEKGSSLSRIIIGEGLQLDAKRFADLNPAVIVFHLLTGENLSAGLDFLDSQGLERPPIYCLYISNVGKIRWPDVKWVYEHSDVQQTHARLPWSHGEAHIL